MRHRIVLVEDHTLLREGLRSLLAARPEFEVVGEAGDGLEAIAQVRKLTPDLVIMDLSMPKMNGLEALREIMRQHPVMKVIALTMHNSEEYVREALAAGASGYVLKVVSHGELITAIGKVLAGKRYLSPDISKSLADGRPERNRGVTPWESLTHREREVLKMIAEGYKSREIGEYLGISLKTVEKHRANLMQKLDLHSVSAVTAFAAKKGLIS
jgi:DNA-binding NarL/FixJ family response regulator